jgi:ribosome biogenesis protein Tsr3
MENPKLIYKRNNNGGANAYAGKVKVGSYFYNLFTKEGKYKVGSTLLDYNREKLKSYADTEEEARQIIEKAFAEFWQDLTAKV